MDLTQTPTPPVQTAFTSPKPGEGGPATAPPPEPTPPPPTPVPVQPIQPPKTNKLLFTGVIILILVILAGGGLLAYQNFFVTKPTPTPSPTPIPSPTSTPDITAGWKTYDYPNLGYSFRLPTNYLVLQGQPAPSENYILQELDLNETTASMGPNDFILTVQSQSLDSSLQILIKNNEFSKTGTKVINGKEWTIAISPRETQYLTQSGNRTYTLDGRNISLLEQILSTFKFTAETTNNPVVSSPAPNSKVVSPLTVTGTVPAGWMFEGVFPVKLLGANKNVLASGQGKETVAGSWQSGQSVAFTATLTFTAPASGSGTLVLQNDNPSGDPSRDKTFEVPVSF